MKTKTITHDKLGELTNHGYDSWTSSKLKIGKFGFESKVILMHDDFRENKPTEEFYLSLIHI